MRKLAGVALLLLLCACGCSAPNPVQISRGISLFEWYAPSVTVVVLSGSSTNAPSASALARRDTDTQAFAPQNQGICVIFDTQFCVPNGGGTSTSNTVIPTLSFTP
jgi:hypothetical protein